MVKKKIKVLQCIRQGQIGGGESHLLSLVENLDRSKFDPVVLSFTDGPMIERLKQMNVETFVIHTNKPFDIRKWRAVKEFIKQQQVDIIHAHGTRANSNVFWPAKKLGIPVIYTVHGWSFHPDQHPITRQIRIWGEKYLTSKSALNISVSKSNQESGKIYIKSFRSRVINNGIDQSRFDPTKKFSDIREEINIPSDKLLILFLARFTSHKQPLILIKAFAKACDSGLDAHLLMVGDGDEISQAKKLIIELGLSNKITLQPFRQDVPDLLAAADIFVLPSLWEGLPIGLLEAMAMGKAVAGSNVDGTKEVIQNNVNGILIETDNLLENLVNTLNVLANDADLRSRLGIKAKEAINEKYNAVNMTRQIENCYLEIALKKNINPENN
jgi:glycosyltransferase involved in cell wall biosynthesis